MSASKIISYDHAQPTTSQLASIAATLVAGGESSAEDEIAVIQAAYRLWTHCDWYIQYIEQHPETLDSMLKGLKA